MINKMSADFKSNPDFVKVAIASFILLCQLELNNMNDTYDKESIIKTCDLIREGLNLIEDSI